MIDKIEIRTRGPVGRDMAKAMRQAQADAWLDTGRDFAINNIPNDSRPHMRSRPIINLVQVNVLHEDRKNSGADTLDASCEKLVKLIRSSTAVPLAELLARRSLRPPRKVPRSG